MIYWNPLSPVINGAAVAATTNRRAFSRAHTSARGHQFRLITIEEMLQNIYRVLRV